MEGTVAFAPDHSDTLRRALSSAPTAEEAMAEIAAALVGQNLAFVILFVSPGYDLNVVAERAAADFPDVTVLGCTTAGEIGAGGYETGTIVCLGFGADDFAIRTRLIHPLDQFSLDDGGAVAADLLVPDGFGEAALWPSAIAMVICDGLSRQEDAIVAALAPALGAIPLIGGSAGDGLDFGQTLVLHDGRFHESAAVAALIRTRCRIEAFRLDNFVPTDRRMVVTGADPAERLVTEINAEPAAREYARIMGKDPDQLSPFIFAENPVVVRIGGEHFCRSIQQVENNGDLRFYSAIDEGLVLTAARSEDIVRHLDERLAELRQDDEPLAVLGFDCVLRRLDVESSQRTREMSEVLVRHGVVGFNTYGEQYGGMHLNQTFTGAAIYAPDPADA